MITTQSPVDCYQILIDYNEDDDKEEEHDDNTTSTLTSTPLIQLHTLELDKALVHLSHLDIECTENILSSSYSTLHIIQHARYTYFETMNIIYFIQILLINRNFVKLSSMQYL